MSVDKSILIDVAVLCQEYEVLEKTCDDHVINLDDIRITKREFQELFYPHGEQFGLNRQLASNPEMNKYISLLPNYRSVEQMPFYLLEFVLKNIEKDLCLSRDCFSRESLIEVSKQLSSINSLLDMNCCSLLTSLTWSNIKEMVQQYQNVLVDENVQEFIPVLVISIIFKTPTEGVLNTIVKFHYRIVDFY